jgi:hypothetical protein
MAIKKQQQKAVSFSKTLVDSNRTTQNHTPEGWNLQHHHYGNLRYWVKLMSAGQQLQ